MTSSPPPNHGTPPEGELKPLNRVIANLLINDFKSLLKKHKLTVDTCGVSTADFVVLASLYRLKILDKKFVVKILDQRMTEIAKAQNVD